MPARMLVPLLRTAWFTVDRCASPRAVVVYRTGERFDDIFACERGHRELLEAVLAVPEPRGVLLMDMRNAIGRNDPAFEGVIERVGARLFASCSSVVMLMRTETGRLHVQRFHRQRGSKAPDVFLSEEEAWAFIHSQR